ncbi:MAG: SDR family NAD(P)-dependent oxidoreductase [Solirubrobacterales bacterium]|nr:SDR family NAD(P)-dependent oxidoreductase [Solirubrobacterales bacterium]MBV9715307.1 SDR family NAD(P)-dependent oxidoreductase [Solirubrobacterales bacterium]
MELRDRNLVITGAASGIGRALAERFAAEAPRALTVADLDLPGVEAVARATGAQAVRADVSREEEIQALIARALEAGGEIDLFFSNAGVPGPAGGPEAADAEFELAWRVNVMAHIWAARALLPGMVARGDGYLLSTASAAGLLMQVSAMPYSVTKHAAVAVAEWLSVTYGDAGVKVSCLCPQAVRTPMLEGALEDPVAAAALLSDDVIEPAEVAETVIAAIREERFLILPHAAVAGHMALKGAEPERWLRGMRRLVRGARG